MSTKTSSARFFTAAITILALTAYGVDSNGKTGNPNDPSGKPERPPYSMHAHQDQWSGSCLSSARTTSDQLQSPVALAKGLFPTVIGEPLVFSFQKTKGSLVDVGHTFQLRFQNYAGKLQFEKRQYELKQLHFHKPGEHVINNKIYDMEMHLVYVRQPSQTSDRYAALALGIPIERGKENPTLAKVWKFLPPMKEGYGEDKSTKRNWQAAIKTNEIVLTKGNEAVKELKKDIDFDASDLLPKNSTFYVYEGSLTTPGCEENITHAVSSVPIELSDQQIEHFEGYYEGNNRDLQPVGDAKPRHFRVSTAKVISN